ncbi:uncharacterized protein LOC120427077 [Culex pipiens pallens]|uniref:uncharacterized protein LOC120427077 n=1 Tax=Culex pipiens pallens TaxID=42434 RepID=UPI0019534507|nr:uncharacterized protein LOC120427077 [Culex pipiens pallens]
MKKCLVFFTKLMVCSFAPEDGIFTRDGLADSKPPLLDNTSLAPIKTATFGKPRKICHQLDNRIRNRRIGRIVFQQRKFPNSWPSSQNAVGAEIICRRNYSPRHIAVAPYPMSSTNGSGERRKSLVEVIS